MDVRQYISDLKAAQELIEGSLRRQDITNRIYVDSYRLYLSSKRIAKKSVERLKYAHLVTNRDIPRLTILPYELAEISFILLIHIKDKVREAYETSLQEKGVSVLTSNEKFRKIHALARGHNFDMPSGATFIDSPFYCRVFAPQPPSRYRMRKSIERNAKNASPELGSWLRQNLDKIDEGYVPLNNKTLFHFGQYDDFIKYLNRKDNVFSSMAGVKLIRDIENEDLLRQIRNSGFNTEKFEKIELKEKGVDTDLIISVMDDLHSNVCDGFTFITNDTDFTPLFQRVIKMGKRLFLAAFSDERLASHLTEVAQENKNFIDLLDVSILDFDNIWLRQLERQGIDREAFDNTMRLYHDHVLWEWHQENIEDMLSNVPRQDEDQVP
jgi:uncharacterized LabA/DUF88 family protein